MCEQTCVLHSHREKKEAKEYKKKQNNNTIWYVIMYESVLALFEFG